MDQIKTLLQALKDSGLSQVDISKRTGIPQPRLSRWANGEVPAAAGDALKLQALVMARAAPAAGGAGDLRSAG